MKSIPRFAALVGLGAVMAALVGLPVLLVARPQVLADLHTVLVSGPARGGAIEARHRLMQQVRDGKRHVIAELIAGRLSLAEAVERFERLEGQLIDGQDELDGATAGPTGRDEAQRNVLDWVYESLRCRTDRDAVLARLAAQGARLNAVKAVVPLTICRPPAG